MLRTTCSLLATYLDKSVNEIEIDSINASREGFRPYLQNRKYKENSIRTYVNHVRLLLRHASELGWKPDSSVPEEWHRLLHVAGSRICRDVVVYLARTKKKLSEIAIDDVDRWGQMSVERGLPFHHMMKKKTWFWRLLRDQGCTQQTRKCILREKNYGIPVEQFPPDLKREVLELLSWKQAANSEGSPIKGRLRRISAKRRRQIVRALFGYAVNIRKEAEITSISALIRKEIRSGSTK